MLVLALRAAKYSAWSACDKSFGAMPAKLNRVFAVGQLHAPEKIDGDLVQEVEIYLKFIGRFDLPEPELTEEEKKRQEQLRRHRIKSREHYQKIKTGEHTIGEPFQLTCKCCGKTFESKMSNAMFCDQNCRAKYYRQEAAKKRERECTCENCGTVFATNKNSVKYCCEACMKEANRKRQQGRKAAKETGQENTEAAAVKEAGQKEKTA